MPNMSCFRLPVEDTEKEHNKIAMWDVIFGYYTTNTEAQSKVII